MLLTMRKSARSMSTGSSRRFMRLNSGRMCCLHSLQLTLCFPALEYTQSSLGLQLALPLLD